MARNLLYVALALVAVVHGRHEQYEGHRVFRVNGPSDEIKYLDDELDLWKVRQGSDDGQVEAVLRLAPEQEEQWLKTFASRRISYEVVHENVANLFREEDEQVQQSRAKARSSGEKITWETYYRHEEINDHLDDLAARYPDLVTVINAGLSYEGRQIKYVRISTSRFENLMKPVIVIDAAVHAREWITTPVALYIIHQLVENVDPSLTDNIDWIIIPLGNPDGYEYTHDEERLWRKTRSNRGSSDCRGVDINRNYEHEWGTTASAANPCAITFEGPTPFSEPETVVIRNAVLQHQDRTQLYLSLHSFGNMFLYAWGNNATLPSNGLNLHLCGVTMGQAIDAVAMEGAINYTIGNAAQVLYFTTGTSRDWTRAVGIPLTYTVELPGYEYGFLVPPTYIRQVITETWAGIVAGGRFVLNSL